MLPALGTALSGMLLLSSAWPCFFQDLRFALATALAIAVVAMRARRAGTRTVLVTFAGRARPAPHKPLMLFGAEVWTCQAARTMRDCQNACRL
ncbi:hypothetical protein BTVI_148729 [Pitangus sulphuratus]|nr:hypothetical protein BTVI_148729 [Pitangus sulphuratus]